MKMSESRTKSLEAFRSFIGGETFTRSDIFSFTENGKNTFSKCISFEPDIKFVFGLKDSEFFPTEN